MKEKLSNSVTIRGKKVQSIQTLIGLWLPSDTAGDVSETGRITRSFRRRLR